MSDQAVWLKEHLSYELLMLDFAIGRIRSVENQLEWNAFYESFVVHARNLYFFLTNKGEGSDYNASDFVAEFKSAKDDLTIGKFQKMHHQVLHMGKHRPKEGSTKLNRGNCEDVYRWMEGAMRNFIGQLEKPYDQTWRESNAAIAGLPRNASDRRDFYGRSPENGSDAMTTTASVKYDATSGSIVPKK